MLSILEKSIGTEYNNIHLMSYAFGVQGSKAWFYKAVCPLPFSQTSRSPVDVITVILIIAKPAQRVGTIS